MMSLFEPLELSVMVPAIDDGAAERERGAVADSDRSGRRVAARAGAVGDRERASRDAERRAGDEVIVAIVLLTEDSTFTFGSLPHR